jgi:alpha-galactosidase
MTMKRRLALLIAVLACGGCSTSVGPGASAIELVERDGVLHFDNARIKLRIDGSMTIVPSYDDGHRTRSMVADNPTPSEYLVIDGEVVDDFPIARRRDAAVTTRFGRGRQLTLTGEASITHRSSPARLRKELVLELYDDFPNAVVSRCTWTNLSPSTSVVVDKAVSEAFTVDRRKLDPSKKSHEFFLFQGPGHDWGKTYADIEIGPDYSETNSLGVTVADRDPPGGGIPVLDLWAEEMGMAVAHVSPRPEFLDMPVAARPDGRVTYAIEERHDSELGPLTMGPGESLTTVETVIVVHSLDFFDALRTYARLLSAEGVKTLRSTPDTVPDSYWKTWGYELDFKVADILAKLPEFKELGIEMVVLDDGWFSNYGDWEPSPSEHKFPRGRADLIALVRRLHREGFKVGVWWCPLIAEPTSDVARAHPDWFMEQADATPYLMKKPDSYFLCPAHEPVLRFWEEQIEKLFVTFDLDYVYHDWANLIEVPPCYNPSHQHSSPLEPYWKLSHHYERMYEKIQSIKPGCAIEMCECGRPHDPYKMPYYNLTNASDATSERQVRARLKVEKALGGSRTYFAPGYVRPEPGASYDPVRIDAAVAMGGYFCTYYTALTPEQKAEWLKWLGIYGTERIFAGEYLNLYDIAHDVPEMHVTRASGSLYYFGPGPFAGQLELRGLEERRYRVADLGTGELVATVTGPLARVPFEATGIISLKATPVSD